MLRRESNLYPRQHQLEKKTSRIRYVLVAFRFDILDFR